MALQGQEALNYLQQAGYLGGAVSQGAAGASQAPNDYFSQLLGIQKPGLASGIAGFVSGLTQPFRTGLLQQGADIVQSLGSLGSWSQGGGDINKSKNIFVTDREGQNMRADRVLGGLKSGAGIAAYAVPGGGAMGGGIKGAATSGAMGGAMGGFSASDYGNELGGTLTGAVMGAGTGAALAGAGKGINKLRGRGKSAQQYTDDIIGKVENRLSKTNVDDVAFTRDKLLVDEVKKLPKDVQEDVARNLFDPSGANNTTSLDSALDQIGKPRLTKGGNLFQEDDYAKNVLQRTGKDLQYDAAGFRGSADVNTLTYADDLVDDKRAIDWAIKNTGLGDGPTNTKNIGTKDFINRLGKLRKDAVNKIDVQVEADDVFKGLDEQLSLSQNISKDQARNLLRERFQEVASDKAVNVSNMNLDDLMNDRVKLNEKNLFDMTQKLGDDTAEYYRLERHMTRQPSAKLESGKLLDDRISGILEKKSPTIGKVNRAYRALYRQKGGNIQAFDRNANISITGGKAGIMQQLQNPVQKRVGMAMEKLGDAQAGAMNLLPQNIQANLAKLPTGQVNEIAQKLAPIYMAQQAVDGFNINNDNMNMNQNFNIQGTPTGGPDGMTSAMNGGFGQQSQIPNSGVDPRRKMLAQGLLNGSIDPSRAKLAMELLGIGGNSGSKALPSQAVEKMAGAQASLAELDQLQQQVENSGQFGAVTGGSIKDTLNDIPFLGALIATPEREAIRTQTDMLALNMANALTTGTLSDRDIAMFKSMMPNLSDNPQVASAKIAQVRNMLQNKIQSQQQGYVGAGYNPSMIQDPAATPGYSDYQQMY